LIGRQWSSEDLFYAAAIPAVISTVVMIVMRSVYKENRAVRAAPVPLAH
jgi:hypothetical protein